MPQRFELKRISADGVLRAVERAEHYRLLNDPEQTESICLDVLAVDPDNKRALIAIVLAITDQFAGGGGSHTARRALEYVEKLPDEYERLYYSGLVAERQGRAHLHRGGMSRGFAYEALEDAMDFYAKAETLKPPGIDDALLRWNACARTIERENLQARVDEPEILLE